MTITTLTAIEVFRNGTAVGNNARSFQKAMKPFLQENLNQKAKAAIDLTIATLKERLAILKIEGNETAKHPACFALIVLGSGILGRMTTDRAKDAASWMIETQCDWKTALAAAERQEEFENH